MVFLICKIFLVVVIVVGEVLGCVGVVLVFGVVCCVIVGVVRFMVRVVVRVVVGKNFNMFFIFSFFLVCVV